MLRVNAQQVTLDLTGVKPKIGRVSLLRKDHSVEFSIDAYGLKDDEGMPRMIGTPLVIHASSEAIDEMFSHLIKTVERLKRDGGPSYDQMRKDRALND